MKIKAAGSLGTSAAPFLLSCFEVRAGGAYHQPGFDQATAVRRAAR
jgi:hypothetical protein